MKHYLMFWVCAIAVGLVVYANISHAQRINDAIGTERTPPPVYPRPHPVYRQPVAVVPHTPRLTGHYTFQVCGIMGGQPVCSPMIDTQVVGTDPDLFAAPPEPGPVLVPDMIGMTLAEAQTALHTVQLGTIAPFSGFSAQAAGRVYAQSIPPGSYVKYGTAVRFWVSAGRLVQ